MLKMQSTAAALATLFAGVLVQFSSVEAHRDTPLVPSANFPKLFETIASEYQNMELEVTKGAFPDWVSGEWIKTGFCGFEQPDGSGKPNPDPSFKFTILFDTLGCAYRFQLKNGQPRFTAKYIKRNL